MEKKLVKKKEAFIMPGSLVYINDFPYMLGYCKYSAFLMSLTNGYVMRGKHMVKNREKYSMTKEVFNTVFPETTTSTVEFYTLSWEGNEE